MAEQIALIDNLGTYAAPAIDSPGQRAQVGDSGGGADSDAGITNVQKGPTFYNDARIDGRIDNDLGILVVPLAAPLGTPPVIIAVHAPFSKRVVEFTSERNGARPELPDPQTNNPNDVLAFQSIMPGSPTMHADGTPIFRTSGRYVYAEAVFLGVTGPFPCGSAAFDNNFPSQYTVQPQDFDPTQSDASSITPQPTNIKG